jgi:hypothetical protein
MGSERKSVGQVKVGMKAGMKGQTWFEERRDEDAHWESDGRYRTREQGKRAKKATIHRLGRQDTMKSEKRDM